MKREPLRTTKISSDTGCCSVPPDDSWDDLVDGIGWGIAPSVGQVTPGFGNFDEIPDPRLATAWTIARQIRRFRPDVIVTCHDLEGDYGHSNHTANAIGMIDAWTLAADPAVNIDGLDPWQASKLYLRGGPDDKHSEWWTLYRSEVGPDSLELPFTVAGDTTNATYTGWARGDFFQNLTVFADRDDDGLPDRWEIAHFGNFFVADPAEDSDGDGCHNQQEFIVGTDPTAADAPDFAIVTDPLAIDFSVPSAAAIDPWLARRDRVVHSPDLEDWSTVLAEGIGDGTPLRQLIVDGPPGTGRGFYRLEIETVNTP